MKSHQIHKVSLIAPLLISAALLACAPASQPLPGVSNPDSALSDRARPLRLKLLAATDKPRIGSGLEKGFLLCPGQIRALQTRILLSGQILPNDEKTLRGKGFEVSRVQGQSVISQSRDLSPTQLQAGLELEIASLPAVEADIRSIFYDADGGQLGFIRYSTKLSATDDNHVSLRLGDLGAGTSPCPTLSASLSGATLISSVGTPASRLPPTLSPSPSTSPSPSPTSTPMASPSPAQTNPQTGTQPGTQPGGQTGGQMGGQTGGQTGGQPNQGPPGPQNLLVAKATDRSLTITWRNDDAAFSYKLFIDGRSIADIPAPATRYEFTGLASGSQYMLGVQALGPAGPSQMSMVVTRTRER